MRSIALAIDFDTTEFQAGGKSALIVLPEGN